MNIKTFFGALPMAYAVMAFGALAPTSAQADSVVVVTPSTMGDWAFDNRDLGSNLQATTGSMVNGPATPPLGSGSANLVTPAGAGDNGSEIRNTGYSGTALASITALSYSTYASSWNGQQLPYLVLYVNSPTAGNDRFWFEPTYSSATQPAVAQNQWQTWDALNGGWYDDAATGGSSDSVDHVVTWAALMAVYGDGTIVNANYDNTGLGGVRLSSGFASPGNHFDTNVDGFKIGINGVNTTYDFEAAAAAPATPLPAALPMFGSALGLAGGYFGWRRKKKATA